MSDFSYNFLEQEYDLRLFNTDFGRELTESRDPDVVYVLSDLEIRLYESPEYGLVDLIHPFRPSGDIIVEVDSPEQTRGFEMFLDGTKDSFQKLDDGLMKRIESEGSKDYYKKIL